VRATQALLVAALALAGCASESTVPFATGWPARGDDYRDVTAAWTRHGALETGYQQALTVDAVFKSPAWRVASIDRVTALARLSDAQRTAMITDAQKADAESYELELLVTTWDRRENDLHRPKSVWKVLLIDDAGVAIEPASIERDRRPENTLRAEYPALGDFAQAYVARFPRRVELMRPGARKFTLRIWGMRGAVDVDWRAR
jgi:hypothetical protein